MTDVDGNEFEIPYTSCDFAHELFLVGDRYKRIGANYLGQPSQLAGRILPTCFVTGSPPTTRRFLGFLWYIWRWVSNLTAECSIGLTRS